MTVAIYGNRRQQPYLAQILSLLDKLASLGVDVVMHAKLHEYLVQALRCLPGNISVVGDDEPFDARLALSIGGDGTFLNTARWIGTRQIPIAGINTGHLGYLAAMPIADATTGVGALIAGRYIIDERSMLSISTPDNNVKWPYALNEVAILKKDTSSMLNIATTINGSQLAMYRADGLIIATPTGSTGYNLSVGGPILQPSTPAFVIAPIAPHSLSMRPVVIDDRSAIACVTDTRSDSYLLSLDGRSTSLRAGSKVTIHRAPFSTRVAHLDDGRTFVSNLRSKLHWGE